MIHITTQDLKAVSTCIGDDRIRIYLTGVAFVIREHCAYLVATDGHRMIVAKTDRGTEEIGTFIVPRDIVAAAIKSKQPAVQFSFVEHPKARVILGERDDAPALAFTLITDGRFPDWERVIPSDVPSGIAAQFNPQYLADFGKVQKLYGKYGPHIWHNGPEKAVRITFTSAPHVLGILMPIREGDAPQCEWAPVPVAGVDEEFKQAA